MSSATEKALKAKADADVLIQEAIKEQLAIIKDAQKRLAELGYKIAPAGTAAKKPRNTRPSKKHCPICDMNGHDGRAHRGQGKTKKKFTANDLKELGLS